MTKIDRAGLHRIGPIDTYHSQCCVGPSISSSGLRTLFLKSPAHFWCESNLNPKREEQPTKEAFTLGRAAHHLLLGEDAFSTLFIVRPDRFDSWRTDASKAWRAEQEAAGRTVLLPTADRSYPRHGALARGAPSRGRRHPQRRDRAEHRVARQGRPAFG
jgi:hypothetical protein